MVGLFSDSVAQLRSPDEIATIRRLEPDHDNLRTAIAFGLENGHEAAALTLVHAANHFWDVASHVVEHFEWTSRAAPHADQLSDEGLRSEFLSWAAFAALTRGMPAVARQYIAQSTEIAARADDRRRMAVARLAAGWLGASEMDYQRNVAHGYEALELDEGGDDLHLTASIGAIPHFLANGCTNKSPRPSLPHGGRKKLRVPSGHRR